MRFMNVLEQARWHIRTLWRVLIILIAINILTVFGWMNSQSKIKVDIPPQIPESGMTLTQSEVPDTTIYSFAFYVWQSMNYWETNGLVDYKKNIEQFSPFLSPSFKLKLVDDYNNLLGQGEVQDRIRLMQGEAYDGSDVQYVGH